jgi:hypothetical protein
MTNANRLTVIESDVDVQRARMLIADMIEDSGNFRPEWIAERDWIVVPVQSADHFGKKDIEHLAAAFRIAGCDEFLAVATEPLVNTPVCYKVPTTEEGLRELNEAIRDFYFILLPVDRSWAVVCTKDDYYLAGGPLPFVLLALKTSIAQARADFVGFAESTRHPKMRSGLLDVATRYESTGPSGISGVSARQPLLPSS